MDYMEKRIMSKLMVRRMSIIVLNLKNKCFYTKNERNKVILITLINYLLTFIPSISNLLFS